MSHIVSAADHSRLAPFHDKPAARLSLLRRQLLECDEFFQLPELRHLPEGRRYAALRELKQTGRYVHTAEEVLIGAKLAWRNHARCVGRKHWRALKLIDARDATSADAIADACWEHLRLATNGGALQSVITVGPPPTADGQAYRILSPQIIRYAGYRNSYGLVTGDPAHVEITELCLRLGWRGSGGRFDVLPLLISTPREPLRWYDIPTDLVREVDLVHPDYPWFADLGLKWHALPAVSNMDLQIGGLTYPCAPFSGWYVNTEIGARNLSDPDRYDMLPAIADRLDLDMSSERTLWRDRALVELNRAVLHSYRTARVHIVDHHTVAKQFIDHVESEAAQGRRCPTDWTWVNPPMSAGLTPTFHRYYDPPEPALHPCFVKREEAGYPR